MNRTKIILLSIALTMSCSYAAQVTIKKDSNLTKTHTEVDDKYQIEEGRLWYDDGKKDDEADKQQPKKQQPLPNSSKEDPSILLSKIVTLLDQSNKLQEENLKWQQKIHTILENEFDPQPHYIINEKGERCIANSSADCFEMPLVPEARRVPALADWLKNPTIETASVYALWQTTYFNHLFKDGYSLNLAAKQYGDKITPTDSIPEEFGSMNGDSLHYKNELIKDIISKRSKNTKVFILLGKTQGFELEYPQRVFEIYEELTKLGVQTKLVFNSDDSLVYYKTILQTSQNNTLMPRWEKIYQSGNIGASKEMFTSVDPHATPFIVMKYADAKHNFTQTVGVGKDAWKDVMLGIYRTFILFNVVDPSEAYGSKMSDVIAKEVVTKINQENQKALVKPTQPEKKAKVLKLDDNKTQPKEDTAPKTMKQRLFGAHKGSNQ